MSVLVLMYHRTPTGPIDSVWDVPLPMLKAQIERLREGGVEFIRFSDASNPAHYQDARARVCLTFDDGHYSNLAAFDYLAEIGVPSTAFVIRDFSRDGAHGIISARTVADYADACDFGGHGATHTDLTAKSSAELKEELGSSKAYLEAATQRPVTTMTAPGGRLDERVISEARRCGYDVIGNSVDLNNASPARALNRLSVLSHHGADYPSLMARQPALFWWKRKARQTLGRAVVKTLGQGGFDKVRNLVRPSH